MADQAEILTGTSIREYFKELLGEARERQRVQVDDLTEFYLVNLLSEFADPKRLFVREEDGSLQQEPLALVLARALEAQREERAAALRKIGDTSLWVTGFFSDSLEPRLVDARYYMSMGHLAYSSLARLLDPQPNAGLYEELAEKFGAIVDLLNDVSERVAMTSQQGVLRLYERFLKTGSARTARLLAQEGVIPPLGRQLREVQ
ncbi:hypothetical protein [Vulgatibacter sp.]|uniref:hypothetical protein n=1 Tax=Vulgatibacter sp. TaxID=1971226 RepID=UPI003565FC89